LTIKRRVVTGYFYVALYFGGYQLFVLLSRIILYRILVPEDFGIYNVAIAFIGSASIIGGLGIPSAVIQQEGDETKIISTGATMIMVFVTIAYSILALAAGFIARIYDEPRLGPVLLLLVVTEIANLGGVPSRAIARRYLEFKRYYIAMLLKEISTGLVSLFFAFRGFGYWSLILGRAVSEIVILVLSLTYVLSPFHSLFKKLFRPKQFSKRIAKDLLKLSFGFFLAAATIEFLKDLIPMFAGFFLDFETVGLFSAILFFALLFENFMFLIADVTFSAFSRVQQDLSAIQNGITKFLRYSSFFIIPYFTILETVGDKLIVIILGEKWVPPQGVILLIAWIVLILPFGHLGTAILKSLGDTRTLFLVNFARILTFLMVGLALVPSTGLTGLTIAIFVQYFLLLGYLVALRGKFYFFTPVRFSYMKAGVAAIFMGLLLIYLHDWIHDFISLVLGTFGGLGIFYLGLYLIDRKNFIKDIRELFQLVFRRDR